MSRKLESTSLLGSSLRCPSPATLQLLQPRDSGTVTFVLNKKPTRLAFVQLQLTKWQWHADVAHCQIDRDKASLAAGRCVEAARAMPPVPVIRPHIRTPLCFAKQGRPLRCQVFECWCPVFLQSLDGKQSCGSESVLLSTLKGSVKRVADASSLCVSAESSRPQSLRGKQSSVSKSGSSSLRGSVKRVVDVNSAGVSPVPNCLTQCLSGRNNPVSRNPSLRPR